MAQSVSNEALWVKLSEMDKKLDNFSAEQKSPVPTQETPENKPDFTEVKDGIVKEIKDEVRILGWSSDSHFKANTRNIEAITETIQKVWNIVSRIRKQQREAAESQGKDKGNYFSLWLFKVRKTSFVITILGLLVFTLTLFCMKQQNDYALLLNEYHRQGITIQKLERELNVAEEIRVKKQPELK